MAIIRYSNITIESRHVVLLPGGGRTRYEREGRRLGGVREGVAKRERPRGVGTRLGRLMGRVHLRVRVRPVRGPIRSWLMHVDQESGVRSGVVAMLHGRFAGPDVRLRSHRRRRRRGSEERGARRTQAMSVWSSYWFTCLRCHQLVVVVIVLAQRESKLTKSLEAGEMRGCHTTQLYSFIEYGATGGPGSGANHALGRCTWSIPRHLPVSYRRQDLPGTMKTKRG